MDLNVKGMRRIIQVFKIIFIEENSEGLCNFPKVVTE